MKALFISTDPTILEKHSPAAHRMRTYGAFFDELHILVMKSYEGRTDLLGGAAYAYGVSGVGSAYRKGVSLLTEGEAWIIVTQDPFLAGTAGAKLKKKFSRVRLHVQVHTDFLSPYFRKESLKNRVRIILAKRVLPKADSIQVVSERIKQSFTRLPKLAKKKVFVLPIFVDTKNLEHAPVTEDLKKAHPSNQPILLMASRLTHEKNIPLAIRAFAEILPEHPNALLVIVGEGPKKQSLIALTKHLGVTNNIVFKPWTNHLASLYKTADLFLVTSNYEGYGRTMIESLSAGCPVFATDVGIAREVLELSANGSIFPIGNKEALQVLLREVLQGKRTFNAKLPERFRVSREAYLEHWKKLIGV